MDALLLLGEFMYNSFISLKSVLSNLKGKKCNVFKIVYNILHKIGLIEVEHCIFLRNLFYYLLDIYKFIMCTNIYVYKL
jgi:hypothetical protein